MTDKTPRNTAADGTLLKLLVASAPGGIEAQEQAGQREMLASTTLPTEILHSTREEFEALGFVFGEEVPGDPLFRQAQLPEGWSRAGGGHAMWSDVVDDRGIARVAVFYKAAFYDRRAHMSLTDVGYKVASDHIYGDAGTFKADERLTPDERASAVASAEEYIANAERHPDIYADRLPRAWQVVHGLATS